jgi:tetratricopeptide (TPR) repeat protein
MRSPPLDDLVHRWQDRRRAGHPLSLQELCADCPEQMADLRQHLRAVASMISFLGIGDEVPDGAAPSASDSAGPTVTMPGAPSAADGPRLRGHIPGYEILGELGRGGMGVVYKARQVSLKRFVALKMILAGSHAGADQRARFRTEAEAVARLQHPNIVQVYEVGEYDGLPFLALEFVDGASLARRLGGTPLPPRTAAELVERLAHAVHAAHQAGIVHRDLKPGNVLLAEDGTPKVTDFGLAKQTDAEGVTASTAILGTPSYMAPEQAEGKARQVGPLADVYALGAILYETLTGRAPFRGATLVETLGMVRTREPVPPSQVRRPVPHDLETICLKCLQKEPAKRYPSAFALAEDLRRFLNGEPVAARPIGRAERLWRLCRRNPVVSGLSAALLLLLVVGFVGMTLLWWDAERQRVAAVEAQGRAENLAALADDRKTFAEKQTKLAEGEADKARREASKANQTAQVLTGMFEAADPLGLNGVLLLKPRAGEALTAREILDRGAKMVARDLDGEPETQAKLLDTLGNVYCTLGLTTEAKPLLEKSLALRQRLLPPDHPDLAATLHDLGWLYHQTGDYDTADRLYRQALAIRQKHAGDDPIALSVTLLNLGWLLTDVEDFAAAEEVFKKAVALRVARLGPDHRDVAVARIALAAVYIAQRKIDAAVTPYLQAMDTLRKVEGGKGLAESISLFQQGVMGRELPALPRRLLLGLKDDEEVERCLKRSLDLAREVLGDHHAYVALVLHELAATLQQHHKEEEAERYYRDCLAIAREYGLDHPKTTILLGNFCMLLKSRGKRAEAEQLLEEALKVRRQRHPSGHCAVADALLILAALQDDPGSPRRRQLLREALTLYCQSPGAPREYVSICVRLATFSLDAAELYDVACELGRSAARRKEQSRERDRYLGLAVTALRGAKAKGFKDVARLGREKDLDGLRQREDFKKLVAELEKGTGD